MDTAETPDYLGMPSARMVARQNANVGLHFAAAGGPIETMDIFRSTAPIGRSDLDGEA